MTNRLNRLWQNEHVYNWTWGVILAIAIMAGAYLIALLFVKMGF